jgi:hypothetical protein
MVVAINEAVWVSVVWAATGVEEVSWARAAVPSAGPKATEPDRTTAAARVATARRERGRGEGLVRFMVGGYSF